MALFGCASSRSFSPDPLASYNPDAVANGAVRDFNVIYRQMGLASGGTTVSFVGNYAFFALPKVDSTLAMLSLSIPNRGLTFVQDSVGYEARYSVELLAKQDSLVVARVVTDESVRVTTFKETNRTDESIVYQHPLSLQPGRYMFVYHVRDLQGTHEASAEIPVVVPVVGLGVLSTPVVVYEGTPRRDLTQVPSYLSAPRASAVFGTDSVVTVYLEVRQAEPSDVSVRLQSVNSGKVVWVDTVHFGATRGIASQLVSIPLQRADVGLFRVIAQRVGSTDSTIAPLFVGFGSNLPVISFTEMVDYLRFFASSSRVGTLRSAPQEMRGAMWAAFLREADQQRGTSHNEALRDYFARIMEANQLFRLDAVPGWLSDRGAVFVGLGEPDGAYEQQAYSNGYGGTLPGQYRYLVWEYRDLQARIVFIDEFNSGQWHLLPSSVSYFRSIISRIAVQ